MLAGNLAVLYGPLRPTLLTFVALGLGLLLALGLWLAARASAVAVRHVLRRLALVVSVCSLAAAVTLVMALDQLAQRWSPLDEGHRVIAEVEVDSLILGSGATLEFDAWLQIEAPAALQRRLRARVAWRNPPAATPRAGERWRLLLQLSAPRANRNPGGFDEQREFFRERLQARAVVVPARLNQRLAASPDSLLALRERIARRIRDAVIDRDAAALFAGLAVGATGEISREQWRTFSATGTTHLVAISGMHVTLFCWLVAALARLVWQQLPPLAARVDREPFAAALGVPAAFGYALLAGFGIPTQRTVAMLATWWLLRLSGRVQGELDAFGFALIVVLLIDPFAPLAAGFWLSFVAMFALIAAGKSAGGGLRGWIRDNLRTQWWVGLALLPFTLVWFASIPLAGLLVNLLAIPLFTGVLVPVALLGSALGSLSTAAARPLWWLGERVHEWLWPALVAVAAQPYAVIEIDLAGLLSRLAKVQPRHGELMFTALDAGDGAAFILRTQGHVLVYGTGEQYASEGRAAERLLVPALRELGVERVDLLILARAHAQHAAGAARLRAAMPVRELRGGGEWPGAHWPMDDCARTRRWRWDGVDFSTFGTAGGSCVLRAGFAAGPSVLIPERLDEHESATLAARARTGGLALGATLVVAPRRGSVRAVDTDFVAAVAPQWVLVTGRDASNARQRQVAARWRIDPQRVVLLAREGSVSLQMRAGLPPRWRAYTDLHRAPLWRYHAGP